MATYSAGDIINKTLIAKVKVPIYSSAQDSAIKIGEVQPGNPVGVVYSYLEPNANFGRSRLWWQFMRNGSYYYAPNLPGYYDESALRQQGVLTELEKIEAEQEAAAMANNPWYINIIRKYGIYALVAIFGVAIIKKKL